MYRGVRDLWAQVIDELAAPSRPLAPTLQSIAEGISSLLRVSAVIFVIGSDQVLDPIGFADTDSVRVADLRRLFAAEHPRVGEGVIGRVAETQEARLIYPTTSVPQEDRFPAYRGFAERAAMNSFLAAPMIVGGEVIGVLGIGRHGDSSPLAEQHKTTVQQLADLVGRLVRVSFLVEHGRVAEGALNAIPEAVVALDQDHRITFWSSGAEQLFGFQVDETLGKSLALVLGSTCWEAGSDLPPAADAHAGEGGSEPWEVQCEQSTKSGATVSVEVRGVALRGSDERPWRSGSILVIRDIGGELRTERELERRERLAQAALDASPMMSAVVNEDDVIIAASAEWRSRIGEGSGLGTNLLGAVARVIGEDAARSNFSRRLDRVKQGETSRSHSDYDVAFDDGTHTFSVHTARIADVGVSITIDDVTERAARERTLSFEATHDVLTKLPNRSVLLDRAQHALNRAARNDDRIGLIFCDLDGFKELNDRYGHDTGDDFLECFAERLADSCRVTDTAARLHGDEFALLIEDSVSEDTVQAIAGRVISRAAEPIETPVGWVASTASVGAVVFVPGSGRKWGIEDVEGLLAQADAAMYEAKRRGKNRWVLYDETIRARHERSDAITEDLLRGIRAGEFSLHMQPQFNLSGDIAGADALIRWNHPEWGLIEPLEVFQHSWDLPLSVGDWVVRQVVAVLDDWRDVLPQGFRLAVNTSRTQWIDRNTPGYLLDALSHSAVAGDRLRVKVTQKSLAADFNWTREAVHRLTDAGVEVAVKDFAVGHASLTDLAGSEINVAILDRSLIRNAGRGRRESDLLAGLSALGRALGWRIVAQGVETAGQLEAVRDAGCEIVQGHLLGRPVPQEEFAISYLR
jgi:diguanylate cyclase (GGDEF)-like protein/PAS domain S-box-containing protein